MDELDNKPYILGCNNGSLLAKYEPELYAAIAKSLKDSNNHNEFVAGFLFGKVLHERVVKFDKERSKEMSKDAPSMKKPEKGMGKDR